MSPSGLVCKIKDVIMMELQCLLYEAHTAILWLPFFSSLPSCTSLAQSIHKRIRREVEKVDLKNILGCSPNALRSLNQNFQELRISVFALMMLENHWCVIFSTSSSLLHLWHFTSNCPRGNLYLIIIFFFLPAPGLFSALCKPERAVLMCLLHRCWMYGGKKKVQSKDYEDHFMGSGINGRKCLRYDLCHSSS